MSRKAYPGDMTDEQWPLVQPHLPAARPGGRPRQADLREVVNAVLYLTREGCSWRALPHDFPPWKAVYNYFAAWGADGTWDRALGALRRRARLQAGRAEAPSACCIDSQSARAACGGRDIGTDGHKKVKGRKRHVVTDTLGLLLAVVVTAANADDGVTAAGVFRRAPAAECRRLRVVFADGKYRDPTFAAYLDERGWELEISSKPAGQAGFTPLKVRWVVEQCFGCMGRWRRLSRDYERTTRGSETVVKVSAIHRLLRRVRPRDPDTVFHYKRPPSKDKSRAKR